MEKIIFLDTTLRDGEQSTGNKMFSEGKIKIAKALENMGTDVIEAGFPYASKYEFDTIYDISKTIEKSTIAVLARAKKEDILTAARSIEPAKKGRIHVFLSTSDIHLKYILGIDRNTALKNARESIEFAKKYNPDIQFSPMDFTRTDPDFAIGVIIDTIKAGATTINLPDTLGCMLPDEYGARVKYVIGNVKEKLVNFDNIENIIFSSHVHNDLGVANANTLAGIINGVRQVEVTINGIGERAGNADYASIALSLNLRKDYFEKIGVNLDSTHIKTKFLTPTSRIVEKITGNYCENWRTGTGKTVFSHNSGIHFKAWENNESTFELFNPKFIGNKRIISFSDKSGRAGVKNEFEKYNIKFKNEEEFESVYTKFESLASKQKTIYSDTFFGSFNDYGILEDRYNLIDCEYKKNGTTNSKLKINRGEQVEIIESINYGSINACIEPLNDLANKDGIKNLCIDEYKSYNLEPKLESDAKTYFVLSQNGYTVKGEGIDIDTVTSTVKAYIDGMNKLYKIKKIIEMRR